MRTISRQWAGRNVHGLDIGDSFNIPISTPQKNMIEEKKFFNAYLLDKYQKKKYLFQTFCDVYLSK